jgi:two-component system chemotaxis response regulator CheB
MVALLEIAPQVLPAFVQKFNQCVPWRIVLIEEGQLIEPGVCYIGSTKDTLCVDLDRRGVPYIKKEEKVSDPLNTLFKSSADCFHENAVGVLLNGLGGDGAAGFLRIKARGGVTIALQTNCCVFPNLTQNAIDNGAVTQVVDECRLHEAIETLIAPAKRENPKRRYGTARALTQRFNLQAISLQTTVYSSAADDFQNYIANLLTAALTR